MLIQGARTQVPHLSLPPQHTHTHTPFSPYLKDSPLPVALLPQAPEGSGSHSQTIRSAMGLDNSQEAGAGSELIALQMQMQTTSIPIRGR